MPEPSDDFIRRERITDALLAFEQRLLDRTLPVGRSECWDVLFNREPSRGAEPPGPAVLIAPLVYETRAGITVLRLRDGEAPNRSCVGCDLFGRSHCGGGLVFLYFALRDAGIRGPMELLAIEIDPGVYLPDWERMAENRRIILRALRDYFEARLDAVSASRGVE